MIPGRGDSCWKPKKNDGFHVKFQGCEKFMCEAYPIREVLSPDRPGLLDLWINLYGLLIIATMVPRHDCRKNDKDFSRRWQVIKMSEMKGWVFGSHALLQQIGSCFATLEIQESL